MNLESLLIWAKTTTTTSEYGNIRKPLIATRTDEEETSSITGFAFPRSKDSWTVTNNDEVSTRAMIIYIFHNIHNFKGMHLVLLFFFISPFLTKEIFSPFPFGENTFLDCKQN